MLAKVVYSVFACYYETLAVMINVGILNMLKYFSHGIYVSQRFGVYNIFMVVPWSIAATTSLHFLLR
jgi:hypothetical protein